MNCSPFKLWAIVGSAVPIEVYDLGNLKVQFHCSLRGKGRTHKFYSGDKGGKCEGEYDTPKHPILWHAFGKIVRRLGRGRPGWWRTHTSLLVGEKGLGEKRGGWKGKGF
jgi:hypothetical protein